MARRRAKQEAGGRKPGGRGPKPPEPGVREKDQVNLTDEESRIMPVSGGGFEQAYNAQAVVDTESLLVVAAHVTQAANDKKEVEPSIRQLNRLSEPLGAAGELLADSGYFSESNVKLCEKEKLIPYIAVGREKHHLPLPERLQEPDAPDEEADGVEKMKHRLRTKEGRAIYGQRKATSEPVFGIIKSVMGFRQFLLRGVKAVEGEWDLVTLAWNLKRMHSLLERKGQVIPIGA